MKNSYPVILTPDEPGYIVYIPDFDINTEGNSLTEAIEMARDAIGIVGIDMEDENKDFPEPSQIKNIESNTNDIVTLVDVDFTAYRKQMDNRSVKKNCTLPSWLNEQAEKANINFSASLQRALKEELGLNS